MEPRELLEWILDEFGENKHCISDFFDKKDARAYIVIEDPDAEEITPYIITIVRAKIEGV